MPGPARAVGQIAVPTRDLQQAITFYRDRLGLELLFETGVLAFLMCGDVRLMLAEPEGGGDVHGSSTIYFRVDDIHAARAELAGRGVEFVDEPHLVARMPDHELWMTFFHDADGHLHGLMAEVR